MADAKGKRRTRQHIIADLSVHHVEGLVLRCGFTIQRTAADYGYDLTIDTYNDKGELENEFIRAQVKASDNLRRYAVAKTSAYSFPVNIKDYRLWERSALPVMLVLYDAQIGEAYWLDVQQYAAENPSPEKRKSINVHVPRQNVLGVQTLQLLQERAQQVSEDYRIGKRKEEEHEKL